MAGIFGLLMSGAGVIKDQYFNLTSLLLPGNGTNGAQNNTFLDSGTANSGSGFTITRNGNTTQGTFSPFSQTGWGAYFDGSNDYVSMPDSSAFTMGTGDFTVEAWVYCTAADFASSRYIVAQRNASADTSISFAMNFIGGGFRKVRLLCFDSGGSSYEAVCATDVLNLNAWTHIAGVRDGATLRIYVNGVQQGTANISTASLVDSNGGVAIGRLGDANAAYWLGYISNVRITKGGCLYPNGTTFTPSITPLTTTVSSGTVSLLTCQSNRFIDNAATPNTLTANNGVAITPFSPFAPTQSFSAAAVGGSGYFDGTGDYLSFTTSSSFALTGDFTIECWAYFTSSASSQPIFDQYLSAGFLLQVSPGSTIGGSLYINSTAGADGITLSGASCPINAWNFLRIVRSGSTVTVYCNGVSAGSRTRTGNVLVNSTAFGIANYSTTYFTGYLSGVRIVASALTGTEVPTAPLTAITNTQLLLNFTNAGVVDATAKNVLETVGNAQISTTQSKWGGGSISFDGTSNTGLKAPAGNLFTFGSGAFTVEFWVRFNSVAADQAVLNVTGTTNVLTFYVLSTGSLNYYLSSNGSTYDIASGVSVGSISTGQWYRVALVRSGNTFTPYLNTTAGTTSTSSSALATPSSGTFLHLGMSTAGTSNFNGYIDDVRVTRGVARDMTVLPSAPFPVQ